jgi:hypothetical protein
VSAPPTPPLALCCEPHAQRPPQPYWIVPTRSPAPEPYREPTPAVENNVSNDSADDESSEDELAAMYESSDDQHSVGLVQAGLAAVYKAEVRSTEPRSFQKAIHVVCRLMAGGQHSGTSWRAQCMSRLNKYMQSPNSPGEHSV